MCGTERPGWHTIGRQTACDLYAIHRLAAPALPHTARKKTRRMMRRAFSSLFLLQVSRLLLILIFGVRQIAQVELQLLAAVGAADLAALQRVLIEHDLLLACLLYTSLSVRKDDAVHGVVHAFTSP